MVQDLSAALVWYLYCDDRFSWESVFYRQLGKLSTQISSNLISEVHILVKSSANSQYQALSESLKLVLSSVPVLIRFLPLVEDDPDCSEYAAISYIHENASLIGKPILYMHLKGISYIREDFRYLCSLEWGDFLEWALLENLSSNLISLASGGDVLGCNLGRYFYKGELRTSFEGNFWIAKPCHIAALPCPVCPSVLMSKYGLDAKQTWRLYYEAWVTSAAKKLYLNAYKSHSIHNLGFHYSHRFARSQYPETKRANI